MILKAGKTGGEKNYMIYTFFFLLLVLPLLLSLNGKEELFEEQNMHANDNLPNEFLNSC